MRVLVTGHQGYIGTVLTEALLNRGLDVTGLDVGFYNEAKLVKEPKAIAQLNKDLRDIAAADLKGFDAVIHLAALCNDPLGNLNPDLTYDINHRASVKLARCAKESGVKRFLFSSSCSMYGAGGGDEALNETAPLQPVTPYAVSKVRSEEEIERMADSHFSPVFLRNATAYGISPRFRADLVLNNLTGWAFTTGRVKIMSDGSPWRPLVHVEDIARAFILMLEAPRDKVHAQAFNIGASEENYRVRELAGIVEATVPKAQTEYVGKGEPDLRNYRVSFDKLQRAFPDWKPKWNVRTGAKQLFTTFRKVKLTVEQLQGRGFVRLYQLEHLRRQNFLDEQLRWTGAATKAA